jgi:hypothetical protein
MKYNQLTILKYIGYVKQNHIFQVQCDCKYKTIKNIRLSDIKAKNNPTKSCGKCQGKHLMRHTRIYNTWRHMKARCYNTNNKSYHSYGGRGIKVCDEWLDDFMSFYNWAMANGYTDKLTIDRINVDGNYEPDNCQWITRSENTTKGNLERTYKGFIKVKGIDPSGKIYIIDNKSRFGKENALDPSAITKVCKGQYKHHKGWKFEFID